MKQTLRFLIVLVVMLGAHQGQSQSLGGIQAYTTLASLTQAGHKLQVQVDPVSGKQVYVWNQHELGGSWTRDLFCAIYDKDMNPITGTFMINNATGSSWTDQADPCFKLCTYDNSFVVSWIGSQSGNYDIYAKRIPLDLTATAASAVSSQADLLVNAGLTAGDQLYPSIVYNEKSGELLIGFESTNLSSVRQLYYQRVTYTSMLPTGSAVQVNSAAVQAPQALTMEYNSLTGQVITSYNNWAAGGDVMRRVISYDEATDVYTMDAEINVASYTVGDQLYSSISVNQNTGAYAICWQSYNQGETGIGVYGKVYNSSHAVIAADFLLGTTTANDQVTPRTCWDERTNVLLCFFTSFTSTTSSSSKLSMFNGNATTPFTRIGTDTDILPADNTGIGYNISAALHQGSHNLYFVYETNPTSSTSYCKIATYKYTHPLFVPALSNTNTDMNWVNSRSFNAYGDLLSESRSYHDAAGKLLQSQSVHAESNKKVMAQQPVYDYLDRPAIQTLPAVINTTGQLVYNDMFVPYEPQYWDTPSTLYNPHPIYPGHILGNYYISANATDPNSAQTSYPYSRTIFSDNAPGGVVKQTMAGDALRAGQNHEANIIALPVINELDHYALMRKTTFVVNTSAPATLKQQATKTIVTDANGIPYISFSDKSGHTIATAHEGGTAKTSSISLSPNIYVSNVYYGNPQSDWLADNIRIYGSENIEVYNLDNGQLLYASGDISTFELANTAGIGNIQIRSKEFFSLKYHMYLPLNQQPDYWVYQNAEYIPGQQAIDVHLQTGHNLSLVTGTAQGVVIEMTDLSTGSIVSGAYASLPAGYYRLRYKSLGFVNHTTTLYSAQTITFTFNQFYQEFAYFFYDNAGRLISKVAPLGVNTATTPTTTLPLYTDTYTYSTIGQLLSQTETDAGASNYVYKKDGQLRFSQNAQQALTGKFSFVNYDDNNRVVNSGEYDKTVTGAPATFQTQKQYDISAASGSVIALLETVQSTNNGGLGADSYLSEYATIVYNSTAAVAVLDAAGAATGANRTPRNTWNQTTNTSNKQGYSTAYSYDCEGRIEWMVEYLPGLGSKTVDYVYDANGLLLQTIYQKNVQAERFEHLNKYDNIGRLKIALSRDMNGRVKQHEKYLYALNGSLKRKELAGNLQGLDYVYTIQGWLKGINHHEQNTAKDPGRDGAAGANVGFLPDVFGMSLDYYNGDFTSSNVTYATPGNMTGYGLSGVNNSLNGNLYNGSIRSTTWQSKGDPLAGNVSEYAYKYDYKYQVVNAAFGNRTLASNAFTPLSFLYDTYVQYDVNGNITQKYQEKGAGNTIDDYFYKYVKNVVPVPTKTNNKLYVVNNSYTGNITYDYNAIGQMTKQINVDGSVMNIKYNAAGLVTEVRDNANVLKVSYEYNERGNRVKKVSSALNLTTFYVLDAAGNELSIYTKIGAAVAAQSEIPLYGSARSGIAYKNGTALTYTYEIKDHLSTVRTTIARNRNTNNTVNLLSWADYLPYGEVMPGRNSPSTLGNRYAYQGEFAEKDEETKWNSFDLRMYDANVGRWLSKDPYNQYWSPYVGMGNDPVNGVDPDGGYRTRFGASMAGFFSFRWVGDRNYGVGLDEESGEYFYSYTTTNVNSPDATATISNHREFGIADLYVEGAVDLSIGLQYSMKLGGLGKVEFNLLSYQLGHIEYNSIDGWGKTNVIGINNVFTQSIGVEIVGNGVGIKHTLIDNSWAPGYNSSEVEIAKELNGVSTITTTLNNKAPQTFVGKAYSIGYARLIGGEVSFKLGLIK